LFATSEQTILSSPLYLFLFRAIQISYITQLTTDNMAPNRCGGYYDSYGNCNSAWDRWARWLVLAAIIIGAFLIFFLFS